MSINSNDDDFERATLNIQQMLDAGHAAIASVDPAHLNTAFLMFANAKADNLKAIAALKDQIRTTFLGVLEAFASASPTKAVDTIASYAALDSKLLFECALYSDEFIFKAISALDDSPEHNTSLSKAISAIVPTVFHTLSTDSTDRRFHAQQRRLARNLSAALRRLHGDDRYREQAAATTHRILKDLAAAGFTEADVSFFKEIFEHKPRRPETVRAEKLTSADLKGDQ